MLSGGLRCYSGRLDFSCPDCRNRIITGIVKDNTGAAIPNAHVDVLNANTGLKSNTNSDSQGIFVSPPLHPGDYSVVVEAPASARWLSTSG